ncbi:hypothetical protein L1987_15749 [Smallanthus sonchifolius]|uniref:Uncharacterized protein n=1 Tax=Smallanthus sonchifolius TaxID=185202 RepID=A0ACB9J7A3_9ASTR|nr:hypothetical protein L1987_15749 [Smallanthus sonchifolius]
MYPVQIYESEVGVVVSSPRFLIHFPVSVNAGQTWSIRVKDGQRQKRRPRKRSGCETESNGSSNERVHVRVVSKAHARGYNRTLTYKSFIFHKTNERRTRDEIGEKSGENKESKKLEVIGEDMKKNTSTIGFPDHLVDMLCIITIYQDFVI